jgi:hypothetical protein
VLRDIVEVRAAGGLIIQLASNDLAYDARLLIYNNNDNYYFISDRY